MKILLDYHGLKDDYKGRKELNSKYQVLEKKEFKSMKPDCIVVNNERYGIPQGSAISAVLSNIFMIDFDSKLSKLIARHKGKYLRYSDDFIIILPTGPEILSVFNKDFLPILDSTPGLELQPEKTTIFHYTSGSIRGNILDEFIKGNRIKKDLDYLGFSFDGQNVRLRDKTVSKYYYRMYRKIKTIKRHDGVSKNGKRISCRNLYLKYSIKGAFVDNGNFITYVKRAEKVFTREELIKNISKRHMQKIRKRLKK
jgi:hypothetical protein